MMRRLGPLTALALATALVASGAQSSLAQPPMPHVLQPVAETPASALARRLLKAAQTSDEAFLAFVHEVDPKEHLTDDQLLELRQQWKTLELHGLEQASVTHAELSVFDPNWAMWARFSLDVTAEAPHTPTGYSYGPADRPGDVSPPPRLDPAALVSTSRARLKVAVKDDIFSGAVLIAKSGSPIFQAA
jgi:hypothetical protein